MFTIIDGVGDVYTVYGVDATDHCTYFLIYSSGWVWVDSVSCKPYTVYYKQEDAKMTVEYMRYIIAQVYPNDKWKARVAVMSGNQVIAIYTKFVKEGRIK